jgi:hypothetical protein
MISNNEIQAALITKTLADATITAELDDAEEIRENEWHGTEFSYPNIRIRMISNSPLENSNCTQTKVSIGFQVFSEDASSQEADRISGIIMTALHDKPFSQDGLLIALRTSDLIPAIRSNMRTWKSEVLMNGIVSG